MVENYEPIVVTPSFRFLVLRTIQFFSKGVSESISMNIADRASLYFILFFRVSRMFVSLVAESTEGFASAK